MEGNTDLISWQNKKCSKRKRKENSPATTATGERRDPGQVSSRERKEPDATVDGLSPEKKKKENAKEKEKQKVEKKKEEKEKAKDKPKEKKKEKGKEKKSKKKEKEETLVYDQKKDNELDVCG